MDQTVEHLKNWLISVGVPQDKAAEVAEKFKQNIFAEVEHLSLDDLDSLAKQMQARYPV